MQDFYKIDLKKEGFMFLAENQTRTIMTSGNAYVQPTGDEKIGLTYCHNVLPADYGFTSVGYKQVVPPIGISAFNAMNGIREIFGTNGNRLDISWDKNGRPFVLRPGAPKWLATYADGGNTESPTFDINSITTAHVDGISYICYSQKGVFIYNEDTNRLAPQELLGLEMGGILGIVSAGGYLLAYTKDAIAWSSTLVTTDFIPSATTGAGGGKIADIKGNIIFCTPNSTGFIIYSKANAVAATTTGNAFAPFKYKKIDDAKGGILLEQTGYESESRLQFAYTKAGLQALDAQRAETILPEVTDFLSGRRYDDFDEETLTLNTIDTPNAAIKKKLKYISSRYLVISYGVATYTHALVYDTALQRFGRLRITHTDVFEYLGRQTEPSKESIAFLLADGSVKTVETAKLSDSHGVMMFARLQNKRGRLTTLHGVEVETIQEGVDYSIYNFPSINGKTYDPIVVGFPMLIADGVQVHNFLSVALNHTLVLIGKISATTIQVRYSLHGKP